MLNQAFLVLSNRKRFPFACLLLSYAVFSLSSPKKCLCILLANHAGFSFISLKTTFLLFCCLTTLFSAFLHRKILICAFSANRAVSSFFLVQTTYFLFFIARLHCFRLFIASGKRFLPVAANNADFCRITENNVLTFLSLTYAVFSSFSTKKWFSACLKLFTLFSPVCSKSH